MKSALDKCQNVIWLNVIVGVGVSYVFATFNSLDQSQTWWHDKNKFSEETAFI